MPTTVPASRLTVPSRRWVFPEPSDASVVERLRSELRLPTSFCRFLTQRGYAEADAAKRFLRPRSEQIHPPGLLAGMGETVERLERAIRAGETIFVHGDYDVDGICATALYVRALRAMGAVATPFVPHRLTDGYDLTEVGVQTAFAAGASVILTGDCGIVAHDAIERAHSVGIDVIVTDHHTPGPILPRAVAVVNPNRSDCGYPDKGLAGVGVAYKVCCGLAEAIGFPLERLVEFLDLVAVATIADLAPLTAENRALVRWGLKVLPRTRNPGLRALLRSTGLARRAEITAGQVGYVLAPRINAVGRMGEAQRGVRLLLTDDPAEAEAIAAILEDENRWRREVDGTTLREALRVLERGYDAERDWGIVLAAEGWHPGVIGIVASRVVEQVYRPTVLIALSDGEGKGSARSIRGFNLYEALRDCSSHLLRFGGHRAAAGCSLARDRVDPFREAFNARARALLNPELLVPEVRIDLEVELAEATPEMWAMLRHAAPFGSANPVPIFATRGVRINGEPRVVGGKHLKLTLASGPVRLEAIGFGMGDRVLQLGACESGIDVAYQLEENVYMGRSSIQARIVDLRPAG